MESCDFWRTHGTQGCRLFAGKRNRRRRWRRASFTYRFRVNKSVTAPSWNPNFGGYSPPKLPIKRSRFAPDQNGAVSPNIALSADTTNNQTSRQKEGEKKKRKNLYFYWPIISCHFRKQRRLPLMLLHFQNGKTQTVVKLHFVWVGGQFADNNSAEKLSKLTFKLYLLSRVY